MDTQVSVLQGKLSALTRQLDALPEDNNGRKILEQMKELSQLLDNVNQAFCVRLKQPEDTKKR